MELTDLPEEILFLIIQGLDLYSLESVYNTCKRLRHIVCLHGVAKQGSLSCSVMATVNKFKTNFFKDIAYQLLELNLSGVPDLSKTTFIAALKRLKNLRVLDVSYTNVHIADLIDIHKICPDLKDITINLLCSDCAKVSRNVFMQCQSVFEHCENVHFVSGLLNLMHSNIAIYLVAKANLHSLKYTITYKDCTMHTHDHDYRGPVRFPHFNEFMIFILNWYEKNTNDFSLDVSMPIDKLPILQVRLFDCECIVILMQFSKLEIYASPIFKDFFKVNFNLSVKDMSHAKVNVCGNSVVMMWYKESTTFDETFYKTLFKQIKQYIPYSFQSNGESNVLSDPANRDWFQTVPLCEVSEPFKSDMTQSICRKRQAAPSIVLNYDNIFKEKTNVELSLDFKYPIKNTISLNASCDYLKNLTYLSLVGLGRFSADFFNILFHRCENLVTLNVHTLPMSPSSIPISRTISINTSLKNIRIVHKRVDMQMLFTAFSQCPNLENIHVIDESILETFNLTDPSAVLEKCNRLYNIYIESQMPDSRKTKTLRMFNKMKAKFDKPHINVMVKNQNEKHLCTYDPYMDVFRLCPLKPV